MILDLKGTFKTTPVIFLCVSRSDSCMTISIESKTYEEYVDIPLLPLGPEGVAHVFAAYLGVMALPTRHVRAA